MELIESPKSYFMKLFTTSPLGLKVFDTGASQRD